jgi:hypothetical protein
MSEVTEHARHGVQCGMEISKVGWRGLDMEGVKETQQENPFAIHTTKRCLREVCMISNRVLILRHTRTRFVELQG